MRLVATSTGNELSLNVTKEELNILTSAVSYVYIESKRNDKFSSLAKKQYKTVLDNLNIIQEEF